MTPNTAWSGPWIARFRDGPHRSSQRTWAVGPVWQEIRVAPLPQRKTWFVSGGDGIPPAPERAKAEPWPGEVRYVLHSTRHTRVDGEPTMIASYRLAATRLEDAPVPAR